MDKNLDLRVKKTYTALLKSMYDLLCEKSFDDITVTEICDRAEIRKATFYKHFANKEELFLFMVREIEKDTRDEKKFSYDPDNPWSYYEEVFRIFLEFLDEHDLISKRILTSSALPTLMNLISDQIENDFCRHMKEDQKKGILTDFSAELLANTMTGSIMYTGKWWISKNKPVPKERIIDQFHKILSNIG